MTGKGDGGIEDIVRRLDELLRTMSEIQAADVGRPVEQVLLDAARQAFACRRERERIFGLGSLLDPAWDILLDLFVASGEGRAVTLETACAKARLTPTTAARWIAHLVEEGLVRGAGNSGTAAHELVLTEVAQTKIRMYLARTFAPRAVVPG